MRNDSYTCEIVRFGDFLGLLNDVKSNQTTKFNHFIHNYTTKMFTYTYWWHTTPITSKLTGSSKVSCLVNAVGVTCINHLWPYWEPRGGVAGIPDWTRIVTWFFWRKQRFLNLSFVIYMTDLIITIYIEAFQKEFSSEHLI